MYFSHLPPWETFRLGPFVTPQIWTGLWQLSSIAWGSASVSKIWHGMIRHAEMGYTAFGARSLFHHGGEPRLTDQSSNSLFCSQNKQTWWVMLFRFCSYVAIADWRCGMCYDIIRVGAIILVVRLSDVVYCLAEHYDCAEIISVRPWPNLWCTTLMKRYLIGPISRVFSITRPDHWGNEVVYFQAHKPLKSGCSSGGSWTYGQNENRSGRFASSSSLSRFHN